MRVMKCLLPTVATLCVWFVAVHSLPAQTWAPTNLPTNQWAAVASSADGTKLAVAGSLAGIYTSTNAGATWTSNNAGGGGGWESIASSADGTKLVAASPGGIYTNSGTTWARCNAGTFQTYFVCVASSADGSRLIAGSGLLPPDYLYISTNSGATWAAASGPPSNKEWLSVASSGNGSNLVALTFGGGAGSIYSSQDAGATWTSNNAPSINWLSVAATTNGTKFVAAASSPYGVYTNSGTAWTSAGIPFGGPVACSGDGSTLVVGVANGPIYSLGNAGPGWTLNSAPATNWTGIATSWDGTRMLASVGGGHVYAFPAPPPLTIKNSGSSISLLWPTNAIGFGLEQNSNLTAATWIAVTNVPSVTSTQYQVILDPTNGSSFFRLLNP